jgi:TolB-like protein/tetratricopeptide (TPR) repeat protein
LSLFNELKRRNVFKVGIAYLIASWILLQLTDVLVDLLGLPDIAGKFVVLLLVIGFVPALIFAWAFELTPDGIKKEKDVDRSQSIAPKTGHKLNYIIIGVLVVALGYSIYEGQFASQDTSEPAQQVVLDEKPSTPVNPVPDNTFVDDASIAVIPFLNLSSDEEQAYFSDGLADTILHMLAQIPDLRVAARTSSFKFKDKNEDVREIAALLGVAMVLEGSVQRQGNRVRITVQLIRGADGSHLWSKVFDDTLDDIFRVQDQIAKGVAEAMLSTSMMEDRSGDVAGIDSATELTGLGGTRNVAAYDAFLKGQKALEEGTPEAATTALVQLQLAVEFDPDFARAWVALARAYMNGAVVGTATWEAAASDMRTAAERALALEPRLASAHLVFARSLDLSNDAAEKAHAAILKASELEPNNADVLVAMGSLKSDQGKLRDSLKLTEKAVLINPLDTELQTTLAFRRMRVGSVDQALSAMAKIADEKPDDPLVQMTYALLLSMAGNEFESAKVNQRVLEKNPDFLRALFTATFKHLSLRDLDVADELLSRVEAIAPERAFDDRFQYCILIEDKACYEDYGQRYLDLLRGSGSDQGANEFEAEYALYTNNPGRSIELLETRMNAVIGSESLISDFRNAYTLAVAYDKEGFITKRDILLAKIEATIQVHLANGIWPRLIAEDLFMLAAIRGDAQLAAERLALAIESNASPSSILINQAPRYEKVRNDPAVKAQIERLREIEDQLREQLYAEGVW